MLKRSKGFLLALTIVLLSGSIAGCKKNETTTPSNSSSTPSYLNASGYPIVKEPITIKAFVRRYETQPDYNNILVWQEYEKMTGIKIDWDQATTANMNERRNLALASGELPDIFYRAYIPDKDIVTYGTDGSFIKLNDLIDKYGPNIKKIFEKFPDVKKGLTQHNGAIYTLPAIYDTDDSLMGYKMFVNKKWMDKVGMTMPKNLDDFYEVMKAFRDKDPNGNGKQDEIPFTTDSLTPVLNTFQGSFGVGNRGYNQQYVDLDEKTDKVRYFKITPQYKAMLEYVNKLYKEGLIDKEIFTMKTAQFTAKANANLVGFFTGINTGMVGTTYEKDYVGVEEPLKGPNGNQIWTALRPHLMQKGAFAITKLNKYPEATMRWIDTWYGDEGVKMMYLGIEGVSYEVKPDGSYRYLDSIIKGVPQGTTWDTWISKYVPYAGGGSPTVVIEKYFNGRGDTDSAAKTVAPKIRKFAPKEAWATFNFTPEENEKIVALEQDINTFVAQKIPEFVSGKASFTEWDSFVDQVKKLGVDEYLKLYQAAYDRYKKN